jgi:tripartite-type tricarboxylate transporter receptor subunit TctC
MVHCSRKTTLVGAIMKLLRRQFLHLAAGAAVLPAVTGTAWSLDYPTRPVRIIVGFPPAGATDIVARITAQWLSERLGQSVIVENKPGAGTNLAVQAVVNSLADGYTLLVAGTTNAVNATSYETLPFNFQRDIGPVAGLVRFPLVMIVNPSVPAKTVPEFIAYAKAEPGKISMASFGTGTSGHLAGELFKVMTGVNMVHVPYRGEALALADMIGGQVQMMFSTLPGSTEFIKARTLRPLAVTTATRWERLPDIPTVGETVPGYDATVWNCLGAPRSTPPEIVEKLNREINAGLSNPTVKARFSEIGMTSMPLSSTELGTFIANETEKWGKLVKFAGIKVELS